MGDTANVLVGVAEITLGVGISASVIGYTVDGVNMTVSSSFFDAKVEENEGTIIRRLTDQEVKVSLNVAEGTLANLEAAIPGSDVLIAGTLTIGGQALQEHRLTLRGTTPAGRDRVIVLTAVNPTGEVSTPYKKGEVTVVPMTFSALVDDSSEFGSVTDAVATAPTLVVGADTHAETPGGTYIHAKFSANMADPTGKHLEFWFTEATVGTRAFSVAALDGADTIKLTVSGAAIGAGHALALYYVLGTVMSAAGGILDSFSAQTVVPV